MLVPSSVNRTSYPDSCASCFVHRLPCIVNRVPCARTPWSRCAECSRPMPSVVTVDFACEQHGGRCVGAAIVVSPGERGETVPLRAIGTPSRARDGETEPVGAKESWSLLGPPFQRFRAASAPPRGDNRLLAFVRTKLRARCHGHDGGRRYRPIQGRCRSRERKGGRVFLGNYYFQR